MRTVFSILLIVCICAAASSQDVASETDDIQGGFRDLRLGMSLEDAKTALGLDPNFAYRGDPDVSLLPSSGLPIIQTSGVAFIDRVILQFSDDRLYVLTLMLNRDRLDYYGVFTEFSGRYGEPDRLDPGQSVWLSDDVMLQLERPLTVKYTDRAIFDGVVQAGIQEESLETMTRERFLEQL